MKPLLARVADGDTLVADGAMGSLLMQRGLQSGECPEALNLEKPELLREVAGLYLDAGADIVQTNTFGGSPSKLEHYDLSDRTEEINRAAVAAVRDVVGDRAYVSGSCGPCGKILQPYGDTSPTTVRAGFERQMTALADAGVDVLCIETMTDLAEAILAIEAARQVAPDLPVMATMTFDPTPQGFFTIMGTDIATAVAGLAEAGADIVGSNCGNGSDNMLKVAEQLRQHTDLPLLIQSNAGQPEIVSGQVVYDESPDLMAERAVSMINAGVSIIGGCCGTTPEHIRAFRRVVDGLRD